MVVKSLESYLYSFSETTLFFDIRTDLLYRYRFSVSRFPALFDVPSLDVLTFIMLSPDTCLISSDPCHAIS